MKGGRERGKIKGERKDRRRKEGRKTEGQGDGGDKGKIEEGERVWNFRWKSVRRPSSAFGLERGHTQIGGGENKLELGFNVIGPFITRIKQASILQLKPKRKA